MFLDKIRSFKINGSLLNSISVLNDDVFYVVAGENMLARYNLVDKKTKIIASGCGYGEYKYREPVFVYSETKNNDTQLMVCDWHNHRVIKYVNEKYHTETGIYKKKKRSKLESFLSFLKNMGYAGRYIESHNDKGLNEIKNNTSFIKNLMYLFSTLLRLTSKRLLSINKPNGICRFGKGYAFTQKNESCITFIDENFNFVKNISLSGGRLGNISNENGKVLFCVEDLGKVYELISDEKFIDLNLKLGPELKPFSAVYLGYDKVAFISGAHLYIIDILINKMLNKCYLGGELHGLVLNKGNLYVADRLNSQVHILKVTFNEL